MIRGRHGTRHRGDRRGVVMVVVVVVCRSRAVAMIMIVIVRVLMAVGLNPGCGAMMVRAKRAIEHERQRCHHRQGDGQRAC